jgi:hypothetical protein
MIRQRCFGLGNRTPRIRCRQSGIERKEVPLRCRQIDIVIDRIDRTLRHAHRAIDAELGIDDQKIGAFAETIHRTNIDTIGMFAVQAGCGDNKGHRAQSRGECVTEQSQIFAGGHLIRGDFNTGYGVEQTNHALPRHRLD